MRLAVTFITLIVIATATAQAAEPSSSAVIDLSVTAQGYLISRCLDESGQPAAGVTVELLRGQQRVASTTTRSDGWFRLVEVTPGSYELQAQNWRHPIRVWTADAAPPAARDPINIKLASVVVAAAEDAVEMPLDSQPPVAAPATPAPVAESTPIRELAFDKGALRSGDRSTPDTVSLEIDASHLEEGAAHALHTVAAVDADAPFDPFAQSGGEPGPLLAPPAEEMPLTPPQVEDTPRSASGTAPPAASPAPVPMPAGSGPVQTIQPRVGPTVGDVVITSVGIAGITMGVIAIHKYDNRRIRRVVSP